MLQPGQRLGTYEIVRTLGAGGMGVVYEARHTVLGTRAALKLLLPNLASNERVRARFLQEGYIQHELQHANAASCIGTSNRPTCSFHGERTVNWT